MARPKKAPEEKRERVLGVRLTVRERAEIDSRAALYGLTAGEYMRKRSIGERLPASVAARQERAWMVTSLNRLGVNLNQIAHHMNAGRTAPVDGLAELLARIDAEMDKIFATTAASDYD